jgi:hypothetical protein
LDGIAPTVNIQVYEQQRATEQGSGSDYETRAEITQPMFVRRNSEVAPLSDTRRSQERPEKRDCRE